METTSSSETAVVRLGEIEGPLMDVVERARAAGAPVLVVDGTGGAGDGLALDERDLWRLERFPLPLVFAAAGTVRGLAFDIAVLSDVRICDESTVFETGTRAVARRSALLRSDDAPATLPAESALVAGFVSEVTPPGEALEAAGRLAAVIASRGPVATRLAKEAIWRGLRQEFEQALRFETDLTLLLQTTKDRAEGVRAFVEKRPPMFRGE